MSVKTQVTHRARRELQRRRVSATARRVVAERLTYLKWKKIETLEDCMERIERANVPGDVIETGIALGGSAILLADLMGPGRSFHGYDVFGMIPPPSEKDDQKSHERYEVIASGASTGLEGDKYYGYEDNLYDQVAASFASFGLPVDGERVVLHRGLFEDTLHPEKPVAFAHIDGDWYESVKICLDRIYPKLSPGGFIVLDDFFDYAGCARATHEFLAKHDDLRMVRAPANAVLQRLA
jgi:O-methyltransferase